jgi:hypothetical protein
MEDNVPFDIQPVYNAILDDLDIDLFKRIYLPSALPSDILILSPLSYLITTLAGLAGRIMVEGTRTPARGPTPHPRRPRPYNDDGLIQAGEGVGHRCRR